MTETQGRGRVVGSIPFWYSLLRWFRFFAFRWSRLLPLSLTVPDNVQWFRQVLQTLLGLFGCCCRRVLLFVVDVVDSLGMLKRSCPSDFLARAVPAPKGPASISWEQGKIDGNIGMGMGRMGTFIYVLSQYGRA